MALPWLFRKLFQNDGAGEHLRTDIGALSYDAQTLTDAQKQQVVKNLAGLLLKLSGGHVTGDVVIDGNVQGGAFVAQLRVKQDASSPVTGYINATHRSDSKSLDIYSRNSSGTGNYGGIIHMHASDAPSNPGLIQLFAYNDTPGGASSRLTVYPEGQLVFNNKNVEVVEQSGANYVRYANGLQICWGSATGGAWHAVSLPVPFKDTSYAVMAMGDTRLYNGAQPYTTTQIKVGSSSTAGNATWDVGRWLAIGFWK